MNKNLKLFFKATLVVSALIMLAVLIMPLWIDVNTDLMLKIIASIIGVDILVGVTVALLK